MKHTLLIITALLFIGCTGSMKMIDFDMSLNQVERPKDAKERFGEVNTTVVDSLGKQYLNFEDNLIKAQFLFGYSQIGLLLENKSEHTMKINWDNAAWVNPEGVSSRVIHSGVRLMDRNSPQSPSIIVRNGKLTDIIIPSDNIYYESGQYGGWRYLGLIHHTNVMSMDMQAELSKANSYIGKTCGVLLPIEMEGVQNDYIFTFEIGTATITNRW
jgi:hypothetical protein